MRNIRMLRSKLGALTTGPGVYIFRGQGGKVLYVGKSINVRERVKSHLAASGETGKALVAAATNVESIRVGSELEALLLEAKLIKKYLPKYNRASRDDKHPLYIKVTVDEEYPKILTSRREDEGVARYFGPFPSSKVLRQVLKQIRRIFPYCSQRNIGRRGCFYSHINLCSPCPNEIVRLKAKSEKRRAKSRYKRNIRRILLLLSGKTKTLEKRLQIQMRRLAKAQDFEGAVEIRDQLRRLEYITRPYTQASAYLENPNLLVDIRAREAAALATYIRPYIRGFKRPRRVEAYDVSHTGGVSATCSMVTFVDGEPEKNLYRRFRIRLTRTHDDFAMLAQAVERRLGHLEDWGKPDLMLVDGGKGQVSVVSKVLEDAAVKIPVIGLAKRLEEIVVPVRGGFEVLRLARNNPALQLLQRLRDEAHRFARAYHFKLRLKELTASS